MDVASSESEVEQVIAWAEELVEMMEKMI